MYIYVCMYIYMYRYKDIHIYIYIYIITSINIYTYILQNIMYYILYYIHYIICTLYILVYIYIYMDGWMVVTYPPLETLCHTAQRVYTYAITRALPSYIYIQSKFISGIFIFGRSDYNNAQPAKSYFGILKFGSGTFWEWPVCEICVFLLPLLL